MCGKTKTQPPGLYVVPNFVSLAEEAALKRELLHEDLPFLDKGHLKFSNTKQHEFGPQISDAMEHIVDARPSNFPPKCKAIASRLVAEAKRLGITGAEELGVDGVAFLRTNYYFSAGGGYMHKHMDSKKCFGPVIACCSLLSDAAMTFYDTKGNSFGMAAVHDKVEVHIPRRSLYFMTGDARHQWQHGIRKDQCPQERLSLTFRSVKPDAPKTKSSTVRHGLKSIAAGKAEDHSSAKVMPQAKDVCFKRPASNVNKLKRSLVATQAQTGGKRRRKT